MFDEKSLDDTMNKYLINITNKLKIKSRHTEAKEPLDLKSSGKVEIPSKLC